MALYTKAGPDACGLFKRLLVILYDVLLLTGILMFASLLFLALSGQLGDLEGGAPVAITNPWVKLAFQAYLLTLTWAFFVGFWKITGQTLALQTWRLKVETTAGEKLSWKQATLRFLLVPLSIAPFGLGFLWAFSNPERRAWHDLLTDTQIAKKVKTRV